MNHLEDRVRRALRADVSGVVTEQVLADVHRGADRRWSRRTASVAAAAVVVAIMGVTGVAAQLRGDDGAGPSPQPTTQSPTQSPTTTQSAGPELPPGAAQGVIDVSVVGPDAVFRLTTNVGCVACSTVWRRDASAEGGWLWLHDFEGEDAYDGKVDPSFGPVEYLAMAANGRDGWAWGDRLHSTHDGGRTWAVVEAGPGARTAYGHEVGITNEFAWSLLRTDARGTQLWRTRLGVDDWSLVDVPDLSGVHGILATATHVVLETSDEGLASPRLQSSTDGHDWNVLANPCNGENQVYPAESAAFILCADGGGATMYRTVDLAEWDVFGESTGVVSAVHPLSDESVLVVGGVGGGGRQARLITSSGTTSVDLGLEPGEQTFASASFGDLCFLTTFDNRLLGSTDGGLTWHQVE